ncbi:hypothetical protein CLD22_05570 [Rubrivivax gelatinosus]|nr:hypothetical protein [Rubrivivax gelatinosus]
MTVTVKLDAALEQRLRDSAQRSKRSTSDVIRAALVCYLDASERAAPPSAYELGAELFGRYEGPADLAGRHREHAAAVWADKRRGPDGSA